MAIDPEVQRQLTALQKQVDGLKAPVNRPPNPTDPATFLSTDLHDLGQVATAQVAANTQTIANTTSTKVTWATTTWDNDQAVNLTDNRLTPRVSGVYMCWAEVIFDADSVGVRELNLAWVTTAGSAAVFAGQTALASTFSTHKLTVCALIPLTFMVDGTARRSIEAYVLQTSGGNLDVTSGRMGLVKVADYSQFGTK